MTFLLAAAGTGGHVYPGLAVAQGLLERGVPKDRIIFSGGDRLESVVYPREGFEFVALELRGLKRSLTAENLRIPGSVARSARKLREVINESDVRVVMGMGGYVTVTAAIAARMSGLPFFHAEQNASAGLANRFASRFATDSFTAFPETSGLPGGSWSGNPIRKEFWNFDRERLRNEALERYQLEGSQPVVGVFGGSLGAGALNEAVMRCVGEITPHASVLHLTGRDEESESGHSNWRRIQFEDRMDLFFGAIDLVVARAGGAVAEVTATGTPSILIPGAFGSAGHQQENALYLERQGAALIREEEGLDDLGQLIVSLLESPDRLVKMRQSALSLAKPHAALTIADALIEATKT